MKKEDENKLPLPKSVTYDFLGTSINILVNIGTKKIATVSTDIPISAV